MQASSSSQLPPLYEGGGAYWPTRPGPGSPKYSGMVPASPMQGSPPSLMHDVPVGLRYPCCAGMATAAVLLGLSAAIYALMAAPTSFSKLEDWQQEIHRQLVHIEGATPAGGHQPSASGNAPLAILGTAPPGDQREGGGVPATTELMELSFDCTAEAHALSQKVQMWCCAQSHLHCMTTTTKTTTGLFNCRLGEQHMWPPSKKAWCCQHQRLGCQGKAACNATCSVNGEDLTCAARIQRAAAHPYLQDSNACARAYTAVLEECRVCAFCASADTGCSQPRTSTSSQPYACQDLSAGLAGGHAGWSPAKAAWCCKYEGMGCSPVLLKK